MNDWLKNLDFIFVSRMEPLTIVEDGMARVSNNSQYESADSLQYARYCRQCSTLDSEVLKSHLLYETLLIL